MLDRGLDAEGICLIADNWVACCALILQNYVVQHRIRHRAIELRVLVLELLQALGVVRPLMPPGVEPHAITVSSV